MNRAVGLLVARGWMNLCAIASFLIVGRFLAPAQFGIYAQASSAILLFMGLIGAGFGDYVISRDHVKKEEATAYWATAATGLALAAVAALAAAGLIFFGSAPIGWILLSLTPLPVLYGFTVILEAMLIRDNRAAVMAGVTVTAETLGLAALIASAIAGAGVFALVASRFVNNLTMLAGYLILERPPSFARVQRESAERMGKFSIGVVGSRLMTWADGYGVDLVLGLLAPAAFVGLYRMGGRLNAALGAVLVFAPWQAQLAYLGERFAKAPNRAGAALRRALELHICLIAPLFAGLAFTSQDVIALLLPPQWRQSADVLTIMALGSIAQVIWGVLIAALVASGRSRRMFFFNAASVACTTLALAIGSHFGLQPAAIGKFATAAIIYVTGLFLIDELSPRERSRLFGFLARLAACVAVLALAIFAIDMIAPSGDAMWMRIVRIALAAPAGLAAYLIALWLFAPDAARLLLFIGRKRWRTFRERRSPMPSMAQASAE